MLGKIEGRRRRGQQRMRWLHGITYSIGHEFGWTPEVGDGQRGLACCSPRDHKESETTERLNWTELNICGFSNNRIWYLRTLLSDSQAEAWLFNRSGTWWTVKTLMAAPRVNLMQTSIVILVPTGCKRRHLLRLGPRTNYFSQKSYIRIRDYWV